MIPLYENKINRKVRVFISSTFSDMQNERNIIVHSVFPRLRKAFSAKLIDITEVDLRWGIPEEDSENSRILEICIGEVLHCSPFFVGMIGDRYGSIASDDAVNSLPPAYKQALGGEIPPGLSITELEMRAGVFVPRNIDFSCFLIKQNVLHNPGVQPEVSNLISHIDSAYKMLSYSCDNEFEDLLYRNLYDYVSKVIPDDLKLPYDDNSYLSHLKILKNNNYRYIPDNYFVANLERKINQHRCLYVYGQKGTGKSACMSYLIKEEGLTRDGRVFFHYATAGNQSVRLDNAMLRLRKYLQAEFGGASAEEDNYSAVVEILRSDAVDKRVVLFFDALDHIDDVTAIYKLFALANLNPNVHVVCSGTKEYSRIMNDQVATMSPLTADQILQIVNGTLAQFGKKLSRQMKQDIMKKELCSNPLFLRALLSQLVMYGTYATFDTFFYQLLASENFAQLFSVVVSRIKHYFTERGIDSEQVLLALALIAYSDNGVKESELQDILNLLPVAKSVFLAAIDLFTIEDNGLIRFNHDLILSTTERILKDTGKRYDEIVAELFIGYFANHDDDWRKYSELPYQYRKLGRMTELRQQVSDPNCFLYLYRNEYHTLIGYLSSLVDFQEEIAAGVCAALPDGDKIKVAEIMCLAGCHRAAIDIVTNLLSKTVDPDVRIRLLDVLARSQYKLSLDRFQRSIATYRELLSYYKSVYPEDETGYAARAYLLGVAFKSSGDLTTACATLKECAGIYDRHKICTATSLWAKVVYGQTLYATGKIKDALANLESVISDSTYLFGDNSSELAWAYCYGWDILYAVGDKSNAVDMMQKAYSIYDQLYLGRGSKLAWAAANAGIACMITGSEKLAEERFAFSIKENDAIIPEDKRPHVYSLTVYADLAALYERTGRHDDAVSTIRFAMENSIEKNGADHIYTANIMLSCGVIENDPEKISSAIRVYEKQGVKTPDIFFAKACLARVFVRTGDPVRAAATIRQCADEYFEEPRETALLTYLILDSLEKISGGLSDEMSEDLDELYRFNDYEYYVTHNNNTQIIGIPEL